MEYSIINHHIHIFTFSSEPAPDSTACNCFRHYFEISKGEDGDPLADLEANGVLGEDGGRDGDPLADLEANGVVGEDGGRDGDPLSDLDFEIEVNNSIFKKIDVGSIALPKYILAFLVCQTYLDMSQQLHKLIYCNW